MNKNALIALKILISVSLITWLLSRADLNQIWEVIQSANYFLLLLAFMMFFIGYFITARRWQLLLAALNVQTGLFMLVQSFSIAVFFNNFLPSTIGGDAYRMYISYRLGMTKSRAISVVFIDRIIGLSALIILAFIASLFAGDIARKIPLLTIFFLGSAFAITLLAWIIFSNGGKILMQMTHGIKPPLNVIHRIIAKLYNSFHLFQGRSDVMFKAIGLSLLLQITVVIHFIILARALHIDLPALIMFIIIPLSYLIMTAPVSINGIGLRESVFVYFFGLYGVVQEQALAFAFISFAMILVQGVLGGFVFLFRRHAKSLADQQLKNPRQ